MLKDLSLCLDIHMSMQVLKDTGCSPAPIFGGFHPEGRGLGEEVIPMDKGKVGSQQDGVCFMLV